VKKNIFFGLSVIVFVLALLACDNGSTSGPRIQRFEGSANGVMYQLTITDGSSFELLVGSDLSSGTATRNGDTWTLTPKAGDSFTITVNATGGITSLSGEITFDDGTTADAPSTVEPPPANARRITITGITGQTGTVWIDLHSASGDWVGWGEGVVSNSSVTFILLDTDDNHFAASGNYALFLWFDTSGEGFVYTNGQTESQLGISDGLEWEENFAKLPRFNISSAASAIAFNRFIKSDLTGGGAPGAVVPDFVTHISAEYNGTGEIFPNTPLDDLKQHLIVTAFHTSGWQRTLHEGQYTLEGTLSVGISTITVTHEDWWGGIFTDTFNVTVSDG